MVREYIVVREELKILIKSFLNLNNIMKIQPIINRFFREEKDLFVLVLGLFLTIVFFLHINILPFRFNSLVVFFLFLLFTRSFIDDFKYRSYMIISLVGLGLTILLSPYGVAIFLFIAMVLYKKTRLL